MTEFPDIILYAIPFFALSMLLEIFITTKENIKSYQAKDAISSITMGLGNVFLGYFTKALVLLSFFYVYENFRLFTIPVVWWSFILIFFADDFAYYWFHRISHECRLFWASHVVHHSSQHYNLSTALRQTWSGGFYTFIFWLWLPLIGFHPGMIILQMSISLIYQFWIHTEAINKMPKWFEAVFNTPSHHRVHHGSNPLYLDRNHAGILIIWDKLFGTFQEELEEEKVVYGLVSNINTYNPIKIAFIEWIQMFKDAFTGRKSLKNRLLYFIKPPGWKHDGTGKLSSDLRKEWLQGNMQPQSVIKKEVFIKKATSQ
ncbi:sterol desaturase family protein [Oceanihabitans sediminis]|uniref:Sterol desaturase family protein n=1 Tax=Oceanihabitans sediminis TaxID=1812012 RepID=A0A368P596_9FLAO|nr:sterol desaturase family protein [Oceanihabitans sediminis]MDX1277917.1 sterol desaturase family protein [Oceanihabitans sediminis]MDX1773399.1 sterol desaturase family protein [Oceanihabitans sediminis]RBP32855.1 sterol desaturase/sphingolipid hydroxylase (fatty acid hydroxylase superfamily) [Oceanihabitans sediminis]RCU57616.1 sterol desaturase family protein [Oceanihabitans sediminis]